MARPIVINVNKTANTASRLQPGSLPTAAVIALVHAVPEMSVNKNSTVFKKMLRMYVLSTCNVTCCSSCADGASAKGAGAPDGNADSPNRDLRRTAYTFGVDKKLSMLLSLLNSSIDFCG